MREETANRIKRYGNLFLCLALTTAVLVIYLPVLDYPFIRFDEEQYVTKNPHVLSGISAEGMVWAFQTLDAGFWQPLTWLSHMLDCQIYGLAAGGHHLTNLLLHVANTLLLFLLFKRMTGDFWKSGFVASLFALHPLHVESVVWVADRKDLLSTFFCLLTIGAYVSYVKHPGINRYLLVLLIFFLGLMAKPMGVTLPFLLLCMDIWPLKRNNFGYGIRNGLSPHTDTGMLEKSPGKNASVTRMILEKIPMIGLAVPVGLITIFAERHTGALNTLRAFPLELRIPNVPISYVRYMGKMLWPDALAVFYPYPVYWPNWEVTASGLLLLLLSYFVLRWCKHSPYLAVGWLWYLGSLVPVIGLIQVGSHSIADRYTYVPLIGLFIMIAWGIPDLFRKWHCRTSFLSIFALVLLSLLITISSKQVRYWENTITLFTHAIEVTEKNYLAHINLGAAFMDQGDLDRAQYHFKEALKIKPYHYIANANMGHALMMQGKSDQAILYYRKSLQRDPNNAVVHANLADALLRKGLYDEAIFHYQWLLERKPDNPRLHNNLAVALAFSGQVDRAIVHLQIALRLKPDYPEARDNLGKLQKTSQTATQTK